MKAVIYISVLFTVSIVADQTTPELKVAFDALDTNKDGALILHEFIKFYDMNDAKGDGHMSLSEYVALSNGTSPAQATALFHYYDIDKDNDLTHKDVRNIFKDYDGNGDGKVTLAEFVHHTKEITKLFTTAVGK